KIFDNLRRSLVAPATLALLVAAWTALPGNALVWTAAVLAAIAFPMYPLAFEMLAGPRPRQPWRIFLRELWEDAKTALARVALQLTFLANDAYEMAHAILVTLFRLAFTRRRMLEWETASASAARGAALARATGPRSFLVGMAASPAIAAAALGLVVLARRPGALLAAAPLVALWAVAPLVAYRLSQPASRERVELGP